jgi:hypothetical protein
MQAGRSLTQLATEITRQSAAKADYVAPAEALSVILNAPADANGQYRPALELPDGGTYGITHYTHGQIKDFLKPQGTQRFGEFYDYLLRDATRPEGPALRTSGGPALYVETVNTLLQSHRGQRRMVRTLDGNARALLSDRYRPMDNDEIAERVLPVLADIPGISWEHSSFEITEQRLYMKIVNARVQAEVKVGDVVQAGVIVTNSEIGAGAFSVSPMTFRLICKNGAVMADHAARRYHSGARLQDGGENGMHLLSDDTLRLRNQATIAEMRDLVRGALEETLFGKIVDQLRTAAGVRLEADPVKTVERVQTRFSLNDDERGSVLRFLVEGQDLSLYGLSQALTRAAQEPALSYDRATEMETFGGRIITLPAAEGKALAAAA